MTEYNGIWPGPLTDELRRIGMASTKPDLVCLCNSTAVGMLGHLPEVPLAEYCPLHGKRKCARATEGNSAGCDFEDQCYLVCGYTAARETT